MTRAMSCVGPIVSACAVACCLCHNAALAHDYAISSVKAGLRLTAHVNEGYQVRLDVFDVKRSKQVYSDAIKTDVTGISAEFMDVNGDGFEDIFVRFQDESGFTPRVLINDKNRSFSNAFEAMKEPVYVQTEPRVESDGRVTRGSCRAIVDGLRCTNTVVGANGYREVLLRYEPRTKAYTIEKLSQLYMRVQ